jgi:methylenetetrahydrofolate dehydrogenase (NADP+)/methenyltetrahydrofolate cyclohydrolase
VVRYDESTPKLAEKLLTADIIISATGKTGIIDSSMIKDGAVVIDAGSPKSELADDLRSRTDLTITPNPGGVGPMTVAALFDNLLLAAQK